MKVLITATGPTMDAALDRRFGRAQHFLLCDTERETCVPVDNLQNRQAAQGAGIQAAQTVVESGAECVVTGHCGPKAFRVLSQAGLTVYNTEAGTVGEALRLLAQGALTPAGDADVAGHWE
jgi:predicted Fe-Mo cluster-binding NifX family protein